MKPKKRKIKAPFKILITISVILCVVKIAFPYIDSNIILDSNKENILIDNSNNNDNEKLNTGNNNNIIDSDINNVAMDHSDDNITTLERLKKLVSKDDRINQIINNYNNYPEQLLDMLSRNIEMLDYVMEFLNNKGKTYSNDIGNINNEIPLLLQWDKRWGYGAYGENYVAISGCGPTSLAMVIAGLAKDNSITPYKIAKFAEQNGYYVNGIGTSWSLMIDGAKSFGINSKEIALSKIVVFNALQNGHPIICSMKKGDFTNAGHFIVLVGIENGKIKVNDPNSKNRSSVLWPYERLEPQIKNLWEFYK